MNYVFQDQIGPTGVTGATGPQGATGPSVLPALPGATGNYLLTITASGPQWILQ